MEIGIQVSSVKPLLSEEEAVRLAFRTMAQMGCKTVQLQWIDPSVPIPAIAQALEENHIKSVSVQDFYTLVRENPDYYRKLNQKTGGKWLCISRIPEHYKSREGLDLLIAELRQFQKELDGWGQKLCFHPVSADFTAVPGMDAVSYLLDHMPELDICFDLYHLGKNCPNIPAYLHHYAGRVCMVHFKDSRNGKLVPAGQGDTPWDRVVQTCLDIGVPYAFAEQETWDRDPYVCLKEAMDWISEQSSPLEF